MTKAQLLAIAIKLFAVYLILEAIAYIPMLVGMGGISFLLDGTVNYLIIIIIVVLLFMAMIIGLSVPVAKILIPGNADEKVKWDINLNDIQHVAFSMLGLFVLAYSISDLAYWSFYLSQLSDDVAIHISLEQKASFVSSLVELLIGFYLLFGARGLQGLLIKFRSLGLAK